jgi:hypothetical protein
VRRAQGDGNHVLTFIRGAGAGLFVSACFDIAINHVWVDVGDSASSLAVAVRYAELVFEVACYPCFADNIPIQRTIRNGECLANKARS